MRELCAKFCRENAVQEIGECFSCETPYPWGAIRGEKRGLQRKRFLSFSDDKDIQKFTDTLLGRPPPEHYYCRSLCGFLRVTYARCWAPFRCDVGRPLGAGGRLTGTLGHRKVHLIALRYDFASEKELQDNYFLFAPQRSTSTCRVGQYLQVLVGLQVLWK